MAVHVVNEAKRCLNCKVPQCRTGCPIHTPIPQMISALLAGGVEGAGKMLYENNPLSLVCSLVCDHAKQCEGHCILGRKGEPVHISSIENYISDTWFDRMQLEVAPKNGMRCAIIGSGPAGLTIAIVLARRGYDVTIFEGRHKIGGVLRYGIPEFRLPKSILERYKKRLLAAGVKIRPNTNIGSVLTIDDLLRDGYRSIFIGTGVWRPNTLKVKGESLGNVHYAIDYLASPDSYTLGERVAVIGAGNAAMDVARTVMRQGARFVTVYNRNRVPAASPLEVEYAKIDGVAFVENVGCVEITDDGPVFQRLQETQDGLLSPIPGTEHLCRADSTIISISQGPKDRLVSTTRGLAVNDRGLLVTNAEGVTTRQGIFASGDVVRGARTVVEAVEHSKMVADAMDQYMQGLAAVEEKSGQAALV